MTELLRIPAERVNVLLGKDGTTKKKIEKKCNIELVVDSEGEVQVIGDPADVFFARDVVKAIGRGFNPRIALKLAGDEYVFYMVSLKEVLGSDSAITRLRGRVIGEDGRIKIAIEDATDSFISIYGNTIAIISKLDTIEYAKEAISMLVNGARHSSVLGYLAKSKRTIIVNRLKGR